jgi:hypothetical protein
MTDE